MTNSTKQAVRSTSINSSMSPLGHKILLINESDQVVAANETEFVPKLLEQIIETKSKKQEKAPFISLPPHQSQQNKRNTPLAKIPSISLEEDILEENENTNEEETLVQQTSTQKVSTPQKKIESEPNAVLNQPLNTNNKAVPNEKKIKKKSNTEKDKNEDKNETKLGTPLVEDKSDREKSQRRPNKSKRKQTQTPSDEKIEENFDLYKTQNPSLVYIKQKYKMYLDWLAEHNSIDNVLNNTGSHSSLNSTNHNIKKNGEPLLNWYHYEKTLISSNNKNYFKYLESINQNLNKTNANGPKMMSHSSFGHSSKNNTNGKLLNNRANTNMSTASAEFIQSIPRPINLDKNNLEKFSSYTSEENYLNKNMQNGSKGVKFDKVKSIETSTNTSINYFDGNASNKANSISNRQANDLFYPAISNFFSQLNNSNSSNNSTPLAMYSSSNHPKKPILKSSQSSDYSSSLNNRRGSVLSIGSNQSSEKSSTHSASNKNVKNTQLQNSNNLAENLNKLHERIGAVKLPPIARCSEDFYAVLHGMEKDRLV